jgi:hypothetical protein
MVGIVTCQGDRAAPNRTIYVLPGASSATSDALEVLEITTVERLAGEHSRSCPRTTHATVGAHRSGMKLLACLLVLAALSGRALADDVASPHPTGLQLGMRTPWDVTIAPNHIGLGVVGFGIDLGERVTDRVYLGVMTDYEMVMHVGDADPGIENRLRGGIEARYYFHEGTATLGGGPSGDCGCYGEPITVPRYDWVGLRFGEETVDEFSKRGTFADISLGTDAQIGASQLGAYLSAGISLEPAAAYATSADDSPRTVTLPDSASGPSYYFTLGMHGSFGG